MAKRGALKVPVVGVASSKWTTAQLRKRAAASIRASGKVEDPRAQCMLGNFPQALTHMALVNTAYLLRMPEHLAKRAADQGERPVAVAPAG